MHRDRPNLELTLQSFTVGVISFSHLPGVIEIRGGTAGEAGGTASIDDVTFHKKHFFLSFTIYPLVVVAVSTDRRQVPYIYYLG